MAGARVRGERGTGPRQHGCPAQGRALPDPAGRTGELSGLTWFKSSYSGSQGDDCVEVATCPTAVHVRDSKDHHSPELALSPTTWNEFIAYAAQG